MRKKHGMKSRADLHAHFTRRLRERYGIAADRAMIASIEDLIRRGGARFTWRESCSRTHWEVDVCDRIVRIVYNTKLRAVCTALPNT